MSQTPTSQTSKSAREAPPGPSSGQGQRRLARMPRKMQSTHVTSPATKSVAPTRLAPRATFHVGPASVTNDGMLSAVTYSQSPTPTRRTDWRIASKGPDSGYEPASPGAPESSAETSAKPLPTWWDSQGA